MKLKTRDIQLIQTCGACPEQYEAFIKDFFSETGLRQVGYLRLRHGFFRVDYTDCGGETIYEARPRGDGCFNDDEQEFFLEEAKEAIINKLNEEQSKAEYWEYVDKTKL